MNEELTPLNDPPQQANALLSDLREIIRSGKSQAVAAINSALTLTFWHLTVISFVALECMWLLGKTLRARQTEQFTVSYG